MQRFSRRRILGSLGVLSGYGFWTGFGQEVSADPGKQHGTAEVPGEIQSSGAYEPLDPATVAETAYHIYPEGGCMYAVVGSVISQLANNVGEPFRTFPFDMMRYGDGGVGGWGSLCGIVNGGAALIGLFQRGKSKEVREALMTELCVWYETSSLPTYVPAEPQWADEAVPSVAGSVLCHVSTAKWCDATGLKAFSTEKKERCRRLAANVAIKIVEILNRKAEEGDVEFAGITAEVKSCIGCHGPKELGNAMGKMNCTTCHQLDEKHP